MQEGLWFDCRLKAQNATHPMSVAHASENWQSRPDSPWKSYRRAGAVAYSQHLEQSTGPVKNDHCNYLL